MNERVTTILSVGRGRRVGLVAAAACVLAMSIGASTNARSDEPGQKPAKATPAAEPTTPKDKPKETSKDQHKDQAMTCAQLGDDEAIKFLMEDVGTWDAEITFWFQPGAPGSTTKATITQSMALEGKYLETRIVGGTLGPTMGNLKWSSVSYTGYNGTTMEFESVRMASTTSTMIVVRGKLAADKRTMSQSGTYQFMNMTCGSRDVTTFESPDRRVIDSYMKFGDTPEFLGAKMVLTRRK